MMIISRSVGRAAVRLAIVAAVAGSPVRAAGGELGVAGRESANASIASAGQFVAVAWGAATPTGSTDVHAAISRDGGRTFGAPSRASTAGSTASLSGEQPPRIALIARAGRDPSIVVVWTTKTPGGTRIMSARSDDGGKVFGEPSVVPGGSAAGNRGWQSIATARDGHVFALWLDHRDTAPASSTPAGMDHAGHDPATHATQQADGVARAQLSKLWFADINGGIAPRAIAPGVCYCCKTTIASGADGAIYAAWRHVFAGNVRDIAFTMSQDGGRTFAAPLRVSDDRWVLDGCPENGPALAVDAQRRIHLVWPTMVPGKDGGEATPALFYASSTDGRRFTPRQQIPTEGFPRHPQLIVGTRGGLFVSWDEQGSGSRRAVMARGMVDGNGVVRFAREIIDDTRPASYPVLAGVPDGIVVAWTSGTAGQMVVRTEQRPY
jgi:hypothetical protein